MVTQTLAKKYARAYFSLYRSTLPADFLNKAQQCVSYLKKYKDAFFYLKLSLIPSGIKEDIVTKIIDKFQLGSTFTKLLQLLSNHRRLYMIAPVIEAIIEEYKKYYSIEEFDLASGHELTTAELEDLHHALKNLVNAQVSIKYRVDPNLIAGVRAVSDQHLWEYSVQQILRTLEQSS